jgi:macrophage erythroblast attacher
VQRIVEREREYVIPTLKETANGSLGGTHTPEQTLASLDAMIARMQGLKRKMEVLHEEEKSIQMQSKKRIQHLQDLYRIQNLADVKYDEWSRTRLNRLLVDHMLRSGFSDSAKQLAQDKGIEELVDIDTFVQCQRIAESLRRGEAKEALQWCGENKVALKKSQVGFYFSSLLCFLFADMFMFSIPWSLNCDFNSTSRWFGPDSLRNSWKPCNMRRNIYHLTLTASQLRSIEPPAC